MNRDNQRVRILEAALSGYCNTTRDVADVTGLPVGVVSNYVSEFIKDGLLRRTGRKIANDSERWGPPYPVFEPAKPTAR